MSQQHGDQIKAAIDATTDADVRVDSPDLLAWCQAAPPGSEPAASLKPLAQTAAVPGPDGKPKAMWVPRPLLLALRAALTAAG